LISIPYGAIKRMSTGIGALVAALFQFLMVRLKGYEPIKDGNSIGISIPYGAIKRSFKWDLDTF